MALVSSCKDKIAYFRIKELKDVLTQLGLSKQGKKQDLVDRLLAILSDDRASGLWAKKNAVGKEEVAKLVDDTYRKMQVSVSATDLASVGQDVSDGSNVNLKEESEDSYQMEKIRCPCGSSLKADSMIQCEDSYCSTWQHISCVIIPEKSMDVGVPVLPEVFYCELCRLRRADPFCVTVAHPLHPVKLTTSNLPTDGSNPVQSIEKTFQLTRAEKDLLARPEYDVQAWCMLLNDKVSFRMQWPQYADLQINGVPIRAINRPGSQLLGANGRDDGPVITPTGDGINKISLTGCDTRIFCLGIRIVKRRTIQQILNLIPKESDGEPFEVALTRVRRCIGGGAATENADDSDSDLEVVADCIPVNLRCPMSGSRMKVAGRFKPCVHMGCFDLDVFVEMNQRSRKWQCPICLKNFCLENIIIDPFFNRITSKNCGEDVTDIEVKPDGSWRVKAENDLRALGDLTQWHFPDGTLCLRTGGEEVKSKSEVVRPVKQECVSEGHNTGLKLGIKKNRNGLWEFSKPEANFQKNGDNAIIPVSSSATGSGRDGEDPGANQDAGINFDFSISNGIDLDSIPINIDPIYNAYTGQNPGSDIIILSDSDEEDDQPLVSDAGRVTIPDSYPGGHHVLGTAGSSSLLGLFNSNVDDGFGIPLWDVPSDTQGDPGCFQLFGPDTNVSNSLVDVPHGSINSMNGYKDESSLHHYRNDVNGGGLVDNPLAFGGDDPSLKIFLPTRPSDAAVQADNMRDQPDKSNGIRTEDWISLRLGGSGSGGHSEPAAAVNGVVNPRHQQSYSSKEGSLDSLAASDSSLLGRNDNRSVNNNGPDKASRECSEGGPFSFPRQRRSVRRLYLSIDSDSE